MEYGGRHRRREYDEKDEDREYEERQQEINEIVREFEERRRSREESENTESESEEKEEDQEYEERQREISRRAREFEEKYRSREESEDDESESEERNEDQEYEERQREISEHAREFEEKYRNREEAENTESESDEGLGIQKDLERSGEEEVQENAEEHEKREETQERNEDTEDQQEPEMEKEAPTEVSTGEHEGEAEKPSEVPDDEERGMRPEDREIEHDESGREDTESEDKDEYDDLEKWVIKTMEEKGIDPDELRERWREKFVEDVEDELDEKEQNGTEVREEEEEKRTPSGESETEEGYSTYEDGSGQVYVVKTESSENAETETEATVEKERQEVTTEQTGPESSEQKEYAGAPDESEYPQSEPDTQPSRESTEHTSDSEQQAEQSEQSCEVERPRSRTHEDVPDESSEQRNQPEGPSTQKEHAEEELEEREEKQEEVEQEEHVEKELEEREQKEQKQEQREPAEVRSGEGEEKQESEERLWSSLFPETREDRLQRMIREWHEQTDRVWESLTDAEKDAFREEIRKRLQDEEDFEELVTRHGQEKLRDDEEAREEIERYLYFRERMQEELDNGEAMDEVVDELAEEMHIDPDVAREWADYQSVPEELHDLIARETQYRWRQLLRSIVEAELPQSIGEIRETFDDMLLDDEMAYLKAWVEIIAMQRRGEITARVRDDVEVYSREQISQLESKYHVPSGQIVYWLRGWSIPNQIRNFVNEKIGKKTENGVASKRDRVEPRQTRLKEPVEHQAASVNLRSKNTVVLKRGKSKTLHRVALIRSKLGPYKTRKDIAEKLAEMGMLETISLWPAIDKLWQSVDAFFKALVLLENGTTQNEASRQVGVGDGTVNYWLKGVLPWLIRIVVEPESPRSKIYMGSMDVKMSDLSDLNLDFDSEIRNQIIARYPAFLNMPDLDVLIHDLEIYNVIYSRFGDKRKIRHVQLVELANQLGVSEGKMTRWLAQGARPRICIYIRNAMTNKKLIVRLRTKLPAWNYEELMEKIDSLYINRHLESWANYSDMQKYARKYYKFLTLLETGMQLNRIAGVLEVDENTVLDWMNGQLCPLLHILQFLPHEMPREGHKWLPTRISRTAFSDYIEVPEHITSFRDVLTIADQLDLSSIDFMYVLGFTLADGYVQRTSKTSFSLRSTLSTVYDWSRDIFDDLSDSLNPITHSRVHDIERETNDVVEFSNSTPLFVWVREVVFGLKPSEKKTYTAFSGEWILGSPESLRIAFIQGVADGDGYASAIAQRVGLGSIMNARFIYRLLNTLNIQSYLRRKGVEIFHLNSLLRSESIQMFRNATDKKENLDEICKMIRARPRRKRVSPAEIKFMIRLAKKGLSPGRIAYQLWKKHGISRNIATVTRIVGENT